MAHHELHLPQTTGWRALLTHAQSVAGVHIAPPVEEHLVSLLFRHVGNGLAAPLLDLVSSERGLSIAPEQAGLVGDRCLLCAGLVPEHAIVNGIPVAQVVELGRHAYREFAARQRSEVHDLLAEEFVRAMDVLQTVRALQSGEPCLDGLNAFHLWHEHGSAHGWRVLRRLSWALPASGTLSARLH